MTEITVVETPEAEAPTSGADAPVTEAVTEAAVAIATIEADRDVTLAIVEGENRVAAEAAFAENINSSMERELAECRITIASLETANAALTAQVVALSTPPAQTSQSEANPPDADESPAAMQDSPAAPEAADPPSEPPKRARRSLWI